MRGGERAEKIRRHGDDLTTNRIKANEDSIKYTRKIETTNTARSWIDLHRHALFSLFGAFFSFPCSLSLCLDLQVHECLQGSIFCTEGGLCRPPQVTPSLLSFDCLRESTDSKVRDRRGDGGRPVWGRTTAPSRPSPPALLLLPPSSHSFSSLLSFFQNPRTGRKRRSEQNHA